MSASRTPLHLTYGLMLSGFTSIGAARVAFSLYALYLGATPTQVGLLIGSFYVFPVVISWSVGRYSDRVGSRGLLTGAACLGLAAMTIPFFVRELWALFASALLMGIPFTLYNVLLPNLIGLVSTPAERVRNFSNASLAGSFTMFLAPLFAGVSIDLVGHAAACLCLVSLSVMVAGLLIVWGGTLPGGARRTAVATAVPHKPLKDRELVRALATSSIVQVGQDLYQFYIPVHGVAVGLSASAIGALISTFAVASFLVRVSLPALIRRLGEERVLAYSFYLAGLGFVLVPHFENAFALAAVSFVFGLGIGCGQPITTMLIFSRSPEGRSGETFGLRQTVNNTLRVAAPPTFGLVATAFGLAPVFWLSAALMSGAGWLSRGRK